MTPTHPRTSEPPSTLMGPGWRTRNRTHVEELAAGGVWGSFGARSGSATLSSVLLTWPGDELAYAGEPSDWLMTERPDLASMRQEATSIADFYASRGVSVHWLRPRQPAPPNLVFACDLFFMTPEGAVLARMAAEQRAGEERLAAEALSAAGIPILLTPTGSATFEGADAVWLAPTVVLIGVGRRTNDEGYRAVRRVLAGQGVGASAVEVPAHVQHLLGAVNVVDRDLAVTWRAPRDLAAVLDANGIATLDFADDDEVVDGRALNFVTLAPREIVMPAGTPRTQRRLEAAGVRCHTLEIRQYLRAAGGLGCLTGVIGRRTD